MCDNDCHLERQLVGFPQLLFTLVNCLPAVKKDNMSKVSHAFFFLPPLIAILFLNNWQMQSLVAFYINQSAEKKNKTTKQQREWGTKSKPFHPSCCPNTWAVGSGSILLICQPSACCHLCCVGAQHQRRQAGQHWSATCWSGVLLKKQVAWV